MVKSYRADPQSASGIGFIYLSISKMKTFI